MATVTRVSGLKTTVNKVYNPSGIKVFLIKVQNASNNDIDLRDEDDAVDEVVEMIVKELNPLWYVTAADNSGVMQVIMGPGHTADELQTRIRNMGTSVGANGVDVTGTDVTDNYIVVSGLFDYGD